MKRGQYKPKQANINKLILFLKKRESKSNTESK